MLSEKACLQRLFSGIFTVFPSLGAYEGHVYTYSNSNNNDSNSIIGSNGSSNSNSNSNSNHHSNNLKKDENENNMFSNMVAMTDVPPDQIPEGLLNLARGHRSSIERIRVVISTDSNQSSSISNNSIGNSSNDNSNSKNDIAARQHVEGDHKSQSRPHSPMKHHEDTVSMLANEYNNKNQNHSCVAVYQRDRQNTTTSRTESSAPHEEEGTEATDEPTQSMDES